MGGPGSRDNVRLLWYQTRSVDHGVVPGPGFLRFNTAGLLHDTTGKPATPEQLAAIVRSQLFQSKVLSFEDSLQTFWLADRTVGALGTRLLKGFPMMEDVVFYRAGNFGGIPSNCFWKAVAYQVYGDLQYDIRVKAEHLKYFSDILSSPGHPRRMFSFFGPSQTPSFSTPSCGR